jgi:protein phosphatase
VVVQGPGPGPRYGHVMALVGQRFLLTIGGNDGNAKLSSTFVKFQIMFSFTMAQPEWFRTLDPGTIFMSLGKRPLADVWALDTAAKPYEWRKLEPEGEGPPPCM